MFSLSKNVKKITTFADTIEANLRDEITARKKERATITTEINEKSDETLAVINDKIGKAGGLVPLDDNMQVPAQYLPAYVDTIESHASASEFPRPGREKVIYVDESTNETYRWSGQSYISMNTEVSVAERALRADKLGNQHTINGEIFDGSQDVVIYDSTKVAKTGDTMTGNLAVPTLNNYPIGSDSGWSTIPAVKQNGEINVGKQITMNTAAQKGQQVRLTAQADGSLSVNKVNAYLNGTAKEAEHAAKSDEGKHALEADHAKDSTTFNGIADDRNTKNQDAARLVVYDSTNKKIQYAERAKLHVQSADEATYSVKALNDNDDKDITKTYLHRSGDSMTGKLTTNSQIVSTIPSTTWLGGAKSAAILFDSKDYVPWLSGHTKNGYVTLSAYPGSNDNLYFSYLTNGRVTAGKENGTDNQMTWNAASNNLTATSFTGHLIGNADTATRATNDSDGAKIADTYLKRNGGNISGNFTFASTGDTGTSGKISWNGSTDGADIYYQATAKDQGNLVLNTRDDSNAYVQFANNGTFHSYVSTSDGVYHGNVTGNLNGNAATATNAKNDDTGTRIKGNYLFTGNKGLVDNFDTLFTEGLYQYSPSSKNAPASTYGQVLVLNTHYSTTGADSWIQQIAFSTGQTIYKRQAINNTTWSAWKQIAFVDTKVNTAARAEHADTVTVTAAANSTKDPINVTMAGNDNFRIRVGGADNAGYAEIATGYDGTEPVYVRQYKSNTAAHSATLLDGNGATSFPVSVTTPTMYTSNWYRSNGATGWYSQTYGGGIYMKDNDWVRVFNNKGFYADGKIQSVAGFYGNLNGTAVNANTLRDLGLQAPLTAKEASGVQLHEVYNNGYPTPYGNVITVGGNGGSELLLGWSGTNNGVARLYYRNRRDALRTTSDTIKNLWSPWKEIAWTDDKPANAGHSDTSAKADEATWSGVAKTLGKSGGTGGAMTFNWSGKSGQPTWLWGGTDGTNMYVYNPSNFNVSSAVQANKLKATYSGNGGKQPPNYFGRNALGSIMSNESINGDSSYKNWIYLDPYGSDDAGGTTAIGVSRNAARAFIMSSDKNRTSWNWNAELLTTANYAGYVPNKAKASDVASKINAVATGTNSAELVSSTMGDNDYFRIIVGGTATDAGFAEIATADNGNEPIYVRQYSGKFATVSHQATLLDVNGNTSFTGTVTAPNFAGLASKATADKQGREISSTYISNVLAATKAEMDTLLNSLSTANKK